MTAQYKEILHYNSEIYHLASEPLESYLDILGDQKPIIIAQSTACHRGYIGTWEIEENRLYLIAFKGFTKGFKTISMEYLFPNQKKVFAGWFSGEIKIPQGKKIWGTYGISIREEDWYLKFNTGILIDSWIVDNRNRCFKVGRINPPET